MTIWDADVTALLTEGSVTVQVGATTTVGLRRTVTEPALEDHGAPQNLERDSVLVPSGVPSLTIGGAITVAGVAKTIADFRKEEDGAVTRILLTA